MDKLHESGYHENVVHLNNNYDDGKLGAMCMSDHDNAMAALHGYNTGTEICW